MKIQNIIRVQAIVVGLGAALTLAGATRAQEIENTRFDDGPNVTTFAQPTTASVAVAPASTAAVTPSAAANSASSSESPVLTQEAVLSLAAPLEGWMIAFLLLCIGLYVTYTISEIRIARRNLHARMRAHLDRRIALS